MQDVIISFIVFILPSFFFSFNDYWLIELWWRAFGNVRGCQLCCRASHVGASILFYIFSWDELPRSSPFCIITGYEIRNNRAETDCVVLVIAARLWNKRFHYRSPFTAPGIFDCRCRWGSVMVHDSHLTASRTLHHLIIWAIFSEHVMRSESFNVKTIKWTIKYSKNANNLLIRFFSEGES